MAEEIMIQERRQGHARRLVYRYLTFVWIATFLAIAHVLFPGVSLFAFVIPGGAALALSAYTVRRIVVNHQKKRK